MQNLMQAMVMTDVGGTDVLHLRSISKPKISDAHHILVRVVAAGVSAADVRIRKRMPPMSGWEMPAEGIVLGIEAAGIVEEVGSAVTRFKAGDEVYYFDGGFIGDPGNYTQFKVLNEHYASRKPGNLSFAQAAVLPVVAVTSWESLHDHAHLTSGERVLVQGGAGGLGHIGIQLAKLAGAHVAATVSSEKKADLAYKMDADLVLNYRSEDVASAIGDWTSQEGLDVVYDTAGDSSVFAKSLEMLGYHGRFVTAAYPTAWPQTDIFPIALRNIRISFEAMGHAFRTHALRVKQAQILERITQYVEAEQLQVHLDRCYPLDRVGEAHEALENSDVIGRIAVEIPH